LPVIGSDRFHIMRPFSMRPQLHQHFEAQ